MFKKDISPHKKREKNFNADLIFFIKLSTFFIVIILGIYLLNFAHLGISNKQEVWAQFGDYFGGVLNPIFAFLAFIALLITIKLQNDALKQSKEELELTRKELEKSAKAQQEQSKSLELQNQATNLQIFENTFFNLMEIFIGVRNAMSVSLERSPKYGVSDGLRNNYIRINGKDIILYNFKLEKEEKLTSNIAVTKYLEILKGITFPFDSRSYEFFNKYFEANTRVYFSQIYQILKFIKDNENSEKIKSGKLYSNLLRASFTNDELELIFFHCLGSIGREKFFYLVQEYEFFEHLILNHNVLKRLTEYEIKAFGKNKKIFKEYRKRLKE